MINSSHNDETDYIDLYFDNSTTYSCSNCCGSTHHLLTGIDVDTVFSCPTWANKEISMQYLVSKNGDVVVFNKNVFTQKGKTTLVEISY